MYLHDEVKTSQAEHSVNEETHNWDYNAGIPSTNMLVQTTLKQ